MKGAFLREHFAARLEDPVGMTSRETRNSSHRNVCLGKKKSKFKNRP